MKFDIKKFIPEQIKKRLFWIYIIVVVISIIILKTNLTPPFKIISLVLLIVFQFKYNKDIKYGGAIDTINGILFWYLILVSLAYLFSSFKDYNMAAIMLLIMITGILIASTFSYVIYLWKIKDSKIKKPITKVVVIIILYLALAINIIITFTFFYNVAIPFEGNEIIDTQSNANVTDLESLSFYSGTVFYSSTFGNMLPNGISRWITLFECFISYIVHIILLGIIISSFFNNTKK